MSSGTTGQPKKSPLRVKTWLNRMQLTNAAWAGASLRIRYDGGSQSGETTVVCEFPTSDVEVSAAWAHELLKLAQDDCDSRGTRGTYAIELLTKDEQKEGGPAPRVVGTHTLRLWPAEDEAEPVEEATDTKGVIGQLMRHNEATQRANVQLVMGFAERVDKMLDAQGKVIERLLTRLENAEDRVGASGVTDVEKIAVIAEAVTQLAPTLAPLAERLLGAPKPKVAESAAAPTEQRKG